MVVTQNKAEQAPANDPNQVEAPAASHDFSIGLHLTYPAKYG
jgi:hypothetical protein